jgi:5-methylcytosine-specific restriction endonuclease McrA
MDYSKYHNDWRDVIRPKILERDQYKCRSCGVKHKSRVYRLTKGTYMELDSFTEEWAKSVGKKVYTLFLQVAHLDQDKRNNEHSNLISLCPVCHGRYDKRHKQLKRKIFETDIKSSSTVKPIIHSIDDKVKIEKIKTLVKTYTGVKLSDNQINQLVLIILN